MNKVKNNTLCLEQNPELSIDTVIYRYIPLNSFLDLLFRKKLYVSKKNIFKDQKESKSNLKHQFRITEAIVGTPSKSKNNGSSDISYIHKKMSEYEDFNHLYTSCWTTQCEENMLMWDVYAPNGGVRIRSTVERFVSSLIDGHQTCLCGLMKYESDSATKGAFENLFIKDVPFSDERELRFYFCKIRKGVNDIFDIELLDRNCTNSMLLNVDPEIMIDEIILSPAIYPGCAKLLKDICKNYRINVRPSIVRI